MLAVGNRVEEVRPGDIVVYQKDGADQIELDSFTKNKNARGEGWVAVTEAMIYAVYSDELARYMGIRVEAIEPSAVPAS